MYIAPSLMMFARDFCLEDRIDEMKLDHLQHSHERVVKEIQLHKSFYVSSGIRRGDIVSLYRDRSDEDVDLMIWTGTEFLDLSEGLNKIHRLPLEFLVITEFQISYWTKIMKRSLALAFNHGLFVNQIAYSFTPYLDYGSVETEDLTIHHCVAVSTMEFKGQGHRIFYLFNSRIRQSWEECREYVIKWIQDQPIAGYKNSMIDHFEDVLKKQDDYEFVEGRDLCCEVRIGD